MCETNGISMSLTQKRFTNRPIFKKCRNRNIFITYAIPCKVKLLSKKKIF